MGVTELIDIQDPILDIVGMLELWKEVGVEM